MCACVKLHIKAHTPMLVCGCVWACRALAGAALALTAARSAVLCLLPEGRACDDLRISNVHQLCQLLVHPELAGALREQEAGLAEQLVAGVAAALQEALDTQATEVRQREA